MTPPRASSDFRFRTITCLSTMRFVPAAIVIVNTTIKDAGIMLRPVATAYMMTSWSLAKSFAARTMIAQTTATPKSSNASRDSFFCSGVPTLTPRKCPMASVAVKPHA